MNIIVDGYGGDLGPLEVLRGCEMAASELGINIIVIGNQEQLTKLSTENNINLSNITFVNSNSVITMQDDPTKVVRELSDCSMNIGAKLLAKDVGDAFVSAGNTGALVISATFNVKRIHGIKRSAIAASIPTTNGYYLLLDVGANSECRPDMLKQFAIMGSVYSNKILSAENPTVGLINIGSEPIKGTSLQLETYPLLEKSNLNFIGNVESRELPFGKCDVAVTDGFVGNIILKLTEGVGTAIVGNIKKIFTKNFISKLSALMIKSGINELKKTMDATEYGGAILLGLTKPVIKAHGNSNAVAFKNAIRQAVFSANQKIVSEIEYQIS